VDSPVSRSRPAERRLRVRARPLDEVDESKLALALWLMARRLLQERAQAGADPSPGEPPVTGRRKVA
jgi:hypothetical protein